MPTYRITWKIDEEADTIEEAVCMAWEAMRGADSEATYFEVIDHATKQGIFDDFYDVVHNSEGGAAPVRRELDERPLWERLGFFDAWDEHTEHPRSNWREEVMMENTQRSYWEWVVAQIEEEETDADTEP